eukprot:m.51306 g.51306  ORF g.51306 m.51306 type:complete len:298 (-) comp10725_c0_seq3:130-1023(-)
MAEYTTFDMGAAPTQDQGYSGPPPTNGGNQMQGQGHGQEAYSQPPMQPALGAIFGGNTGGLGAELLGGYASQVGEQQFKEISGEVSKYVNVGQLRFYFQVDTPYVLRKLRILLFPFLNKSWERQGKDGKMLPPKQDVNSPDLYIPVMAFVTYVLVAGLTLGSLGKFSAENLGTLLSNSSGFVLFQVFVCYAALWLMNLSEIGVYDLLAFCGYKYFGMTLSATAYLLTHNPSAYHGVLLWTAVCLGFTLVQTIRNMDKGNVKLLYFSGALTAAEVLFVWWFTSGLLSASEPISTDDTS